MDGPFNGTAGTSNPLEERAVVGLVIASLPLATSRNADSPSDAIRIDRAARLREDRRAQILQKAKEVFAERGYHNASISEIILRAGIARGTFYLYFRTKREVFDSLLTYTLEALLDRIQVIRLSPDAPPPLGQLRDNLRRVVSFLLEDTALSHILLYHAVTLDTESAERLDNFYRMATDKLESSLKLGITMGLVRPCRTRLIAAALLGAVKELVAQLLSATPSPDVEEVVDEILEFGLRGVVVPIRWMGGDSRTASSLEGFKLPI